MIKDTAMNERSDPLKPAPLPRRLKVALIISSLAFIWSIALLVTTWALQMMGDLWGSQNAPEVGGLATLLFGASSLALVMFSVILAAAAFVGWESLKNTAKREIESDLQKRITELENAAQTRISELETALHGRVATAIGFMIGTLHSNPETLEQSKPDRDFLSEAVLYCRIGYDKLKDVNGTIKYWALNNWLYYQCLWGENLKPRKALEILEQGKQLKTFAKANDVVPYLLTYCRIVCQLSTSRPDLEEALGIVADLPLGQIGPLTELQTREAAFYRKMLASRLDVEYPGWKNSQN